MSKTIRFGIIGCGLMGREFASAAARWCHLTEDITRPEIIAVCDTSDKAKEWFLKNFDTIKYNESDYHKIIENPEVDAVYCAVPS